MAGGKWIPDVTAATPVEDAARRVLGVRLEAVRDHLGLARMQPEEDTEHVHQLRVGTRRSRMALDIFSCCLPKRVYKHARKTLRRLRRAASAARDWDVFLSDIEQASQLVENAGETPDLRMATEVEGHKLRRESGNGQCDCHSGFDALLGYALSHRLIAQQEMVQKLPDPFAFDRMYADLLYAIRKPENDPVTLIELARPILAGLIHEMDALGLKDMDSYKNLHQVRIVGKKLRYAMEVFAFCFPGEFRKVHYASVEQMQGILGHINDSVVAQEFLSGLAEKMQAIIPKQWPRFAPDIKFLLSFHENRLPQLRTDFVRWWNQWQNEPDGKAGLLNMLHQTGAK